MHLVMEKSDEYIIKPINQDHLWKKAIADLFEEFILFFLPEFYEEVDFMKPVEFLQQELFKEIIEERKGYKMADQIAKVHLKNGEEQWVLVHTEVQDDDDPEFAKRMFEYFYRIYDRYRKRIVSIALFTNKSTKSSNQFHYVYFGTELSYTFNKFVVDEFSEDELKKSPKLFSKALLASMYMNRTKNKMSIRSSFKRILLKEILMMENTSRAEIRALLYFVDYLLKLPNEMAKELKREIREVIKKEDIKMLSSNKQDLSPTFADILEMEREEGKTEGIEVGRREGRKEGIQEIILKLIENGSTDELISEITNLSVEEITTIRKEMK